MYSYMQCMYIRVMPCLAAKMGLGIYHRYAISCKTNSYGFLLTASILMHLKPLPYTPGHSRSKWGIIEFCETGDIISSTHFPPLPLSGDDGER